MSMLLDCPRCGEKAEKLVIPLDGKMGCRACVGPLASRYDPKLNQTFLSDGKTRLTNGKAWEIMNRRQSKEDPKVYINKITGKPTQY